MKFLYTPRPTEIEYDVTEATLGEYLLDRVTIYPIACFYSTGNYLLDSDGLTPSYASLTLSQLYIGSSD